MYSYCAIFCHSLPFLPAFLETFGFRTAIAALAIVLLQNIWGCDTCNLPVAQMNSANKWKYDRLTVAAVDFASFLDGLNNLNTYAAMHVSLSQYFHMQIDAWIPRQFAQCIDKMQATTLDVQTATVHCGSQRRASNKETFAPGCNYLIW